MYKSEYYSCERKKTYSKRARAKAALDKTISMGRDTARQERARLSVYKCPYCKLWHIGHKVGC